MRVLVVEDQQKLLTFLQRGLQEAGYSVDLAQTVAAATSLVEENPYDLIVLDVNLPDRSGMDFARQIRGDGLTCPILMLTALSATKDKVQGLDAGADDYLTKPFEFDEFLARCRALLRRNTASPTTELRFADLDMDLVTRQVRRQGQAVPLTTKEFSLLEFFLRNPNRPLTRTEISEHVWDVHFDTDSNVIDVYVNMLRKKIDQPFGKKLIHTMVGYGYVLKEAQA